MSSRRQAEAGEERPDSKVHIAHSRNRRRMVGKESGVAETRCDQRQPRADAPGFHQDTASDLLDASAFVDPAGSGVQDRAR